MKFMEIKLGQVLVSRLRSNGSAGAGFPSESLSLSYGKFNWAYTQQKRANGVGGGNASAGWFNGQQGRGVFNFRMTGAIKACYGLTKTRLN